MIGNCKEDWRADGYVWANLGHSNVPRNAPMVRKDYFAIKTNKSTNGKQYDKGFKRVCHRALENNSYVIVQYLGNCELHEPRPHGNSKHSTPFVRCAPSVLHKANQSLKTQKAAFVYKKEVITTEISNEHQGILNPRDQKMLENIRSKVLNENRLSRDEIQNTIELAVHIPGYIRKVEVIPNYTCIGILDGTIELLKKFNATVDQILFSYDTTFNIGCYYVSILVMRHTFFEGDPILPVAILLHESKSFEKHSTFFYELRKLLYFLKKKVVVVVDRERALTKAITVQFPSWTIVHCWNHIKSDIKTKLYALNTSSTDRVILMRQIDQLLHSPDRDVYDKLFNAHSSQWSLAFKEYYIKYIEKDFMLYSARWRLKKLDLYSSRSGITNNSSESFNRVLKTLVRPKFPSDLMMLTFYQLVSTKLLEVNRGLAMIGQFHLKQCYSKFKIQKTEIHTGNLITDIDRFIALLRGYITEQDGKQSKKKKDDNQEKNRKLEESHKKQSTSQVVLAELVVAEKRIIYVKDAACYIITSHQNKKFAVTLSPNTCHCPTTRKCYHIMAAEMVNGSFENLKPDTINLTMLKKKTFKKTINKIGKKKPFLDFENVLPSADSKIGMEEPFVINSQLENTSQYGLNLPEAIAVNTDTEGPKSHSTDEPNPSGKASDIIHEKNRYWIPKLKLPWSEKDVIKKNRMLTSDSMEAALQIAREKFDSVGALEGTYKAPVYIEYKKKWHYELLMKRVPSEIAAQIHHNGQEHWVVSVKIKSEIYVLDSMLKNKHPLSPSLQIQLCQLYADDDQHSLDIYLPKVTQQTNGLDCGALAIANLFNFCLWTTGEMNVADLFKTNFNIEHARNHIITCFESASLLEFPSSQQTLTSKIRKITVPIDCIHCNMPNIFEDMMGCDGCQRWKHNSCGSTSNSKSWLCTFCGKAKI